MIELRDDSLVFSFPKVHPFATMSISFQRTLRIPDDGKSYPLPPGLGDFPLRHVDDFAGKVPDRWLTHGGVMLPMHQAEALWVDFSTPNEYPFAVRIATGKVDAITGEEWSAELSKSPQNYLSIPEQPWLDGFCVGKGLIRQFVASPLGAGYTAEEQLTGNAEHGGFQIAVAPLKRSSWNPRHYGRWASRACKSIFPEEGIAPGGYMLQEIASDRFQPSDWDTSAERRCFVHIANSRVWQSITGERPPSRPPTPRDYALAGLPWFNFYGGSPAIEGSSKLASLRGIAELGAMKGEDPLPENDSVEPAHVIQLKRTPRTGVIREGTF